ncbi:c-type cytochrome [Thiogranum longum]|jgi:cytochrome c2
MRCTAPVSLIVVLLGTSPAVFADVANGKKLHEQQCTKCHDSSVYTRKDRFVNDADALTHQVERCHMNVGAEWSKKDISDVVEYLNQAYYKFK